MVEKIGPRLIRALARFLLGLFYRRIEVRGLEHLPAAGPLVVAANHHNALIDPMLLLATLPRPLRPVAKAPLFRHPLIGPFLRLACAIPVHRRQDEGSDLSQNVGMFREVEATLREGGAILIFPEGVSQPEPALMPLRTGTARMVLGTHIGRPDARASLIPVGLVFHQPGTFRAGWALVLVGRPLDVDDCAAGYGADPRAAVRELTARLGTALRELIVEAGDRRTQRLLGVLEVIWRDPGVDASGAARAAWMRRAMRAYRFLESREGARLERLRAEVERYAKDLELAGVSGGPLSRPYTAGVVGRYALREGGSLALGLPLGLWGLANHLVPYELTRLVVGRLEPSPDAEATYKLGAAVVLYPLCWIGEAWLAFWLGGGVLLGAFLLLLVPTGLFALTWRQRLGRLRRETRVFVRFLVNRDLYTRLSARRQALLDELTALSRLVPDSVLAGPTEE